LFSGFSVGGFSIATRIITEDVGFIDVLDHTLASRADLVQKTRLRLRREAVDLADLTGWDPRKIEANIRKTVPAIYW